MLKRRRFCVILPPFLSRPRFETKPGGNLDNLREALTKCTYTCRGCVAAASRLSRVRKVERKWRKGRLEEGEATRSRRVRGETFIRGEISRMLQVNRFISFVDFALRARFECLFVSASFFPSVIPTTSATFPPFRCGFLSPVSRTQINYSHTTRL